MNGHKYVINETITTRNSPFGQSVFKVRTVDILPLDAEDGKAGNDDTTTTGTDQIDTAEETTSAPAATGTATGSAVDAIETTDNADDDKTAVDRGSPEELEPDHRNEISYRNNNKNERIEVVRI